MASERTAEAGGAQPAQGWDRDLAAAIYPGLSERAREAIGRAVTEAAAAPAAPPPPPAAPPFLALHAADGMPGAGLRDAIGRLAGEGPDQVEAAELPAILNVRPDPTDFRDITYEPGFLPLRDALIPEPLPAALVRDQGGGGSCTGQALAAVVDTLLARAADPAPGAGGGAGQRPAAPASARMLYEMARAYDEMRVDGLSGSSLRGVLKGLFHNGVCPSSLPGAEFDPGDPLPFELTVEMAIAARGISLGSYRRLRHVADDWHAALAETGAVLASAVVHKGWQRSAVRRAGGVIRVPEEDAEPIGAHAFAVVGWTQKGFLVLNSEGPGWGRWQPREDGAPLPGVALWPYADWARHVLDGWVLRLAARAPDAFRLVGGYVAASPRRAAAHSTTPRIEINGHYVNLDHGQLIEQGPYPSFAPSLRRTADWLSEPEHAPTHPRLLLHFEDALDARTDMAGRAAWLVPRLKARGIYPIVVFWAEGFAEAVTSLLRGMAPGVLERAGAPGAVADLMLEAEARRYLRPLWLDLQAQAADMGDPKRHAQAALGVLLHLLATRAAGEHPMGMHLGAHGAGALALAAMAPAIARAAPAVTVHSLHLLSPLCRVEEATALAAAIAPRCGAAILAAPPGQARARRCGPYGGPLAQLIERSLEPPEGGKGRSRIAALEPVVPGLAVLHEGARGVPLTAEHAALGDEPAAWDRIVERILQASPDAPRPVA